MLTKALKKYLIITALAVILGWAGFNSSNDNSYKPDDIVASDKIAVIKTTNAFNNASHISQQRISHILYGDSTGGGHLYGVGKACKSEFPKNWDKDTIIKEIELIASNDNLNWKKQRNGYHVTEKNVGTIKIRVVKGRNNKQVITAYPTNTPRNHCPDAANDK